MSLVDGLLVQTATIIHRARTGAPDATNRPGIEETTSTSPVYLEQISRSEDLVGREAQIGDFLAVFPAGTALDASDSVEIAGRPFEVLGPPADAVDPFDGGIVDHIEVTLREVTG